MIYRMFKNTPKHVFYWGLMNLPVAVSLILMRTAMVELMVVGGEAVPARFVWLCTGAVSLFLLCIAVIGLLSDHGGKHAEFRLIANIDRIYVMTKFLSIVALMLFSLIFPQVAAWQLLLFIVLVVLFNVLQGLYIWLKSALLVDPAG